jgi:AcrR family transcriptional regulator
MAETRRERVHRATREEILAVARGMMLEEGAEGLSLREVARRADFSPASLYTYFASKAEIVAALAEESLAELAAYVERVPADLAPDERLAEICLAYLAFAEEYPTDFAFVASRIVTDGVVGGVGATVQAAMTTVIAATLRAGVTRGVFGALDEEGISRTACGLWAFTHGTACLGLSGERAAAGAAPDQRRLVEETVARLVR